MRSPSRPTRKTYPSPSIVARSPVRSQPSAASLNRWSPLARISPAPCASASASRNSMPGAARPTEASRPGWPASARSWSSCTRQAMGLPSVCPNMLMKHTPGSAATAPGQGRRPDRRRAVLQQPQPGKRQRAGVEQPLDHRGDEERVRDPVAAEFAPCLDAEPGKGHDGRADRDHHGQVAQPSDVIEGGARGVHAARSRRHQGRADRHPAGQPVLPDRHLLRRAGRAGGVQYRRDRVRPGLRDQRPPAARFQRGHLPRTSGPRARPPRPPARRTRAPR